MTPKASCLQTEKIIPLPVTVESNAIALEWKEDLWILVNQPGLKNTRLLKINSSYETEIVSTLPILASSTACCEQQMIVTGSDSNGKPLALGLDSGGKPLWEFHFPDVAPVNWPVASCGDKPFLAWQGTHEKVEVGLLDIESKILLRRPVLSVPNPPVRFFAWKGNCRAGWTEKGRIIINDLMDGNKTEIGTNNIRTREYAVGQTSEGKYYGWIIGNQVFWLLPEKPLSGSVNIANASMGTLKLISGGIPLMWIQRLLQDDDKNPEWESILVIPDKKPYILNGFVFSVAWWQNKVVIVNHSKVLLLKTPF